MNPILQGLQAGYGEEEILSFLSKAIPQLGNSIKKATRSGYGVKQILGFLSKNFDTESLKGKSESEIHAINRRSDTERAKYGLGVAATAVVAPLAANAARSVLSRALPQSLSPVAASISPLNNSSGNLTPQPQQSSQLSIDSTPIKQKQQDISSISSQQPPVNQVEENIPQPVQPLQPEVKTINVDEILTKHKSKQKIDELIGSGNTTEAIRGYFQKFAAKELKEIEKDSGQPFEKVIEQYAGSKIEEPPALKIEKDSLVTSPQGIGEVKSIRNGQALVEVNGKLHKVKEEELESEPEELRELDLEGPVNDYLSSIPESQKSSVIDVSLYDPTTNELQIRFPNGDQWVYSDIPEEIFERINSMTGIPVSSGESKLRGTIWDAGVANSAGADFYKLIKKFVKEGKIKQRKLKTGIDLFKGFTNVKKRK